MTALTGVLEGVAATEALGEVLAKALGGRAGAAVWLEGDLGAGKTTLARGFLRALGVSGAVRSPTYTLMEPYRTARGDILHMDLYRLADAEELWQLGLDSYPPETSVWLVEWPERGGALLPRPDLVLRLSAAGEARRVQIVGDLDLVRAMASLSPILKVVS